MKLSIGKNKYWGLLSLLLMLSLWKLLSLRPDLARVLPPPETVLASLGRYALRADFWAQVAGTLGRTLLGFVCAAALGLPLGLAAGLSEGFRAFLSPILVAARSLPVIALALLILIWVPSPAVPLCIGVLTMFPLLCTGLMEGVRGTDPALVEMARFYKVPRLRRLQALYLPASAPALGSSCVSALGIGWRAVMVGEVLAQPLRGLGTRMQVAQSYLEVESLMALALAAVILSYVFELLLRRALRGLRKERKEEKEV